MYYNVRSLLPKFDELCTICATCKPDVVCLVESWLCDDISDNEIKIPGYELHCLDRNRHGGGVLMYASEQLIVNPLPLCGSNLELLSLSVELLDQRICISIFYRPPSSHIDIFDSLFDSVINIDISRFSQFFLVGDFNVNFNDVNHPLHCKVRYFMESFSLSQVVTGHTHMSYNGHTSLIDLVFLSSPSCLRTCETIPPLGNSDHMGVLTTLFFQRPNRRNLSYPHRKVWCYDLADFNKARRLVSCINWNMIFCDNIDLSLLRWYNTFMKNVFLQRYCLHEIAIFLGSQKQFCKLCDVGTPCIKELRFQCVIRSN